ncbi:ABC transporter permease [Jiangella asiatica]|uniref:ABC transporter permease n=1 Tax=Jiangella asiatica TaxID=2530372 RepID=UPI00193E0926|nr:ABC transporter permease [Jiangella asiatica]
MQYVIRRLGHAVVVIFGAVSLMFVILRLVPGDPAIVYAGPSATPEQIDVVRGELGLDQPLYVQYVSFLGDLVRGDLGESLRLGGSAVSAVADRLPATGLLALSAMGLAVLLSFPLGIAAARRARTAVDYSISTFSLLGQSLPNFWLGLVAILVFSRALGLTPSSGWGTWQHLILPAIVLSLPLLGVLVRLVRAGLIEVMGEPYILTARSKGLTGRVILYRHAMKNMLIPVITVAGLQLGQLLSGTVIVEVVFAWPGVGRLLIDAISNRDFAVVQAVVMLAAFTFVMLNLIVDLLYGYLDPRVRLEAK